METDPNDDIRQLVEGWCDRREYKPLAIVLPAWIGNNGLTDGWSDLRDALKSAYALCRHLPPDERDLLKKLYVNIDIGLRKR